MLRKTLFYSFLILQSLLIINVFLYSDLSNYPCKQPLPISNKFSIIISIFLCALICFVVTRRYKSDKSINNSRVILIASLILLAVQFFITYNIYFYTGWDAGWIHQTIEELSYHQGVLKPDQYYFFSRYPNNINLSSIFLIVYNALHKFNINGYFGLLFLSNIIVNIAGIFTYLSIFHITKSSIYSSVGWFLFVILVGLSPWITIPYSDSYSILFPILSLYLYLTINKENYLGWFLIGFFCFFAFSIKPTAIIVLFSILIYQISRLIDFNERKIRYKSLLPIFFIILGLLPVHFINLYLRNHLNVNIDEDQKFSVFHSIMMGLNTETVGVYWIEDVNYSASFLTIEDRNQANISKITERLNNFGFWGYSKFLSKKALVNFSDGTFSWSCEGGFYSKIPERKNRVSNFLQNIYYKNGNFHFLFLTITQVIWYVVMLFLLGLSIFKNVKENYNFFLIITIFGLYLFVMLFEARARYLYSYSPILIVGAILGLRKFCLYSTPKLKL